MGKVEKCLKICFVVFNSLFAFLGGALLLLTMFGHLFQNHEFQESQEVSALIFLYALGIVTILVSGLGIYGVIKEKKWALIVFLCMISLGCIGLLWFAVPVATTRPQITDIIKEKLQQFLPLSDAPGEIKHLTDLIQIQLKCCGLFNGYKDWGNNIPDSCRCPSFYPNTDKCETPETSLLNIFSSQSLNSNLVYKQPCFPELEKRLHLVLDVVLGIAFGFVALALLGFVMCLMILYQIGHNRQFMQPMMFNANPKPPKYSELDNIM